DTEVELDLVPAFAVHATIAGGAAQARSIGLQRANASGAWDEVGDDELSRPNAPGGVYAFEGLGAGRFRVEDTKSGLFSQDVELSAANPLGRVRLELVTSVHVSGRVEGPADLDASLVRVVLTGDGIERSERPIARDMSFAVDVPAGRRAFVTATHPFLAS